MFNHFARTTLAFTGCVLLGASIASAQATRTWVSGVGDDANPCSRTAPCKTFAGAISKTAPAGEITALDPGGFGVVTITKPITISGLIENGGIISGSTNGIIVNITTPSPGFASVVTLRHLIINGNGIGLVGIKFLAGGALVVDDVHVLGFDTGIETSAGDTIVNRSMITNNRSFGVNGKGGTLTVENSTISNNNVAAQATGTGTVRLANNGVYNNLTGFGCGGGTLASDGQNRKAGNTGGSVPVCSPTVAITLQ
jgi:hypothetical protein